MNCPYCGWPADYGSLYNEWSSKDNRSEFHSECSECGKTFEVMVQQSPDFVLDKLRCAKCQRAEIKPGYAYCGKCEADLKAAMKESIIKGVCRD